MRLISAGSAVRVRPPAPAFARALHRARAPATAGSPVAEHSVMNSQVPAGVAQPAGMRLVSAASAVETALRHHSDSRERGTLPMTNLAARVRRFVGRQRLWTPGAGVVAAVSGGGDSVALLRISCANSPPPATCPARRRRPPQPPAARQTPTVTRRSAARWPLESGVPFDVARVDVAAAAATARCSPGSGGARRPLRVLRAGARPRRCGRRRGGGAHPRRPGRDRAAAPAARHRHPRAARRRCRARGGVVRPLLDCGRDELRAYLGPAARAWVEDETNADTASLRNRIRHDLLPRLARDYQPGCARASWPARPKLAHDDDAYLTAAADTAAAEVTSQGTGGWRLDAGCACWPAGRLSAAAWCGARSRRRAPPAASGSPTSTGCSAVCRTAQAARCRVAGVGVERFSANAVLFSRGAGPGVGTDSAPHARRCPDEVDLPECGAGWRVRAEGPIQRKSGHGAVAAPHS